MGSLIPNAKTQFLDASGRPLVGGMVYMYFPGTENFKDTYQDPLQTIPNTNPIVLDGSGEAVIWGSGAYRQVVSDKFGVQIWDQLTQDANSGLTGNMTDAVYTVGDGTGMTFIPGTTTVFNLPVAPGAVANTWLFFDTSYQTDDQISSISGLVATLTTPVPVGVQEVTFKIGSTIAIGTPGNGTVGDSAIATGSKLDVLSKMWFDPKNYGAKGDGVTDDTTAFQQTISLANAVGGIVVPSRGRYLCGAMTFNAGNGGGIFAFPDMVSLLPNADNVTFITVTNAQVANTEASIVGLTFDNTAGKVACNGIVLDVYEQFTIRDITLKHMNYGVLAKATTADSFGLSIYNTKIFGTGSIVTKATAPNYCFDTLISGVNQFTGGGDTWTDALLGFTRAINCTVTDVHAVLSGTGIGVHCIGDCQGVFLNNSVIVWPSYGILCDVSNGDVATPSYIYGSNFAIDQPAVSGMVLLGSVHKFVNTNLTFGSQRNNTGVGLQILAGSNDMVFEGLVVRGMSGDGVQIPSGSTDIRFFGAWIKQNAATRAGSDVSYVPATARDPMFRDCAIGTTAIISGSQLISGGSTSRYIFSERLQIASPALASNFTLVSTVLSPNSLVDGKTIRITASGVFAANGNAKAITILIGGLACVTQSGTPNGVAWKMTGECLRIDSNSVWMVGDSLAGAVGSVSSVLQSPFAAATALSITCVVSGTAAGDVVLHHLDVELID